MSKITRSANGADCQIRTVHCNYNPETTVFCHLPGGGVGRKQPDIFGAYGCSKCHDAVDGRGDWPADTYWYDFYRGVIRTQQILLDKGLIKI